MRDMIECIAFGLIFWSVLLAIAVGCNSTARQQRHGAITVCWPMSNDPECIARTPIQQ